VVYGIWLCGCCRLWDFDRGENYTLGISTGSEIVTCFSYNSNTSTLAAGTSGGGVVMWSWNPPPTTKKRVSGDTGTHHDSLSDYWELTATTKLPGPLLQLKWDSNKGVLGANCGKEMRILTIQTTRVHYGQEVSAVQVAPAQLLVECHNTGLLHSISTDIPIRGAWVTKEHVAVWSGKKLMVFSFSQDKQQTRVVGSFSTKTTAAAIHDMSVLTAEKNGIQIRTYQGTVKQVLSCGEHEGRFIALTVSGHFLAAGTDRGLVRMWDLSRREARLHEGRNLFTNGPEDLEIVSLEVNSTSSHVSILCQQASSSSSLPTQVLLLWEVETDNVKVFIPSALSLSVQPSSSTSSSTSSSKISPLSLVALPPELPESVAQEQERLCRAIGKRTFCDGHWDSDDSRLLVLTASPSTDVSSMKHKRRSTGETNTVIVVVFVAPDLNVVISDVIPLDPGHSGVVGVSIPYICCTKKLPTAPTSVTSPQRELTTVARLSMKDYVGLETSETATLKAVADFSFHSALGNMDKAFRAIKLIKSEKVWESMARMCVRTQRLDVAAVCLGNMGNAMAAKAVRESKSIPQPEARLAILAVHLNMLNEAERLYKKSGRHDLLNKFYQASGQWEKAIEEAEHGDRMHLKTTYFNYARHAEAEEETKVAINCYTKSGTHHMQVPRMLFDNPQELEDYVIRSHDTEVCKWWAGYLESLGECDQALQFYEVAKDFPSLVRVLCSYGNFEKAAEIVEESGSRAAAYQLASRLRTEKEDVERAIHFYTKAQCYSPAIQLAKEHGLDNELMKLALLSSQEDMIEAAKHYEQSPDTQDKAIILYHKAGEMSRALELCFQLKQYDVLYQIADDLTESTSPVMIARVAEFLSGNGHHERAVLLLIKTKQIEEALDMCMTHNILITEDMAENMTLQKTGHESAEEAERRVKLLEKLGDCCAEQGSYHLATKKHTQAGNKTRAMKALLKSGDTEKIVFFAGVSRQRDVYVMAANYLQSLDWRKDPKIMKNIISFYTKGRALESLASFYDTCAQVEIDEYQDYEKAQGALNEALKCLNKAKSKNPTGIEARVKFLTERLHLVKRFADARRLYARDAEACVQECQALLNEPKLDTAIRTGDVYGLLIEHFAQAKHYREAYRLMEEMHQHMPSVNMAYYVNAQTIEAVHTALQIPLRKDRGDGNRATASDDESIGEGIDDRY
jgi:intraflagellar transport protein 140